MKGFTLGLIVVAFEIITVEISMSRYYKFLLNGW